MSDLIFCVFLTSFTHMPKSVIVFNKDVGKITCKKTKRMPGTDKSKRREIKQCNPMYGHPSDYTAFEIRPMATLSGSLDGSQYIYPWRLHKLLMPDSGNLSYQRIGNSIFIKSLRIKGYLFPGWNNVLKPIRWRLKLYRFQGDFPVATQADAKGQMAAYMTLFNNWETPGSISSSDNVITACRHNFYKAIKKFPKIENYTCRTIASGVVEQTNKLGDIAYNTAGNVASVSYGRTLEQAAGYTYDKGCYPLDVLVKINDRIIWERNGANTTYVPNVYYFLVFEDDFGVGIHTTGSSVTSGVLSAPGWTYNLDDHNKSAYFVSFFARWYYTDD